MPHLRIRPHEFFKPNNISTSMDASLFAITDKAYGITGELWKCSFVQAVDLDQSERFYETLEDPVYVSQGDCRGLQARKLLALAVRDRKPGRLAGSAPGLWRLEKYSSPVLSLERSRGLGASSGSGHR